MRIVISPSHLTKLLMNSQRNLAVLILFCKFKIQSVLTTEVLYCKPRVRNICSEYKNTMIFLSAISLFLQYYNEKILAKEMLGSWLGRQTSPKQNPGCAYAL